MSPEAFWIWKMTLIIICDDPPAASFLEFLPPAKSQPHPLLSTGIMTFASWYFSPLLPFNAAVLILWIFRYQKGSLIRHGHVSIQLCMTSRQFMPVTTFFSYFGGGGDGWKVKLNCNHICQKTNFQCCKSSCWSRKLASLYSGHGQNHSKIVMKSLQNHSVWKLLKKSNLDKTLQKRGEN